MEKQKGKTSSISYMMFAVTAVSAFLVSVFIVESTNIICANYEAANFLKNVADIPVTPEFLMKKVAFFLLVMAASFMTREYLLPDSMNVMYVTICLDMAAGMFIVVLLDFNYNGILLWAFANIIGHMKRGIGQYAFIFLGIVSYALTDYGLLSARKPLFSVRDYIQVYDASSQTALLMAYNFMISLTIIIFILYCVFTIQEERGTIEEVNELYHRLSNANENLKEANIKLEKYAVMKEKMGETKERNRLAREIHDTLGHTLTGISAGLEACIATIDSNPDISKKQLQILAKVTREGLDEVRRSVNELRPDALQRFSLENAIRKMVDDTNSLSGVQVEFLCSAPVLKFDEDEENAIYRVVQEGITNAIRHGHATYIQISIKKEEENIHLSIRDNGCGCEEIHAGFGTHHITERIQLLNGTVRFDGSDGFLIDAMIPIRWGETYD